MMTSRKARARMKGTVEEGSRREDDGLEPKGGGGGGGGEEYSDWLMDKASGRLP